MLLRRITEDVKRQNWTAVALDFVIVVVGVYIGIQAANWNEQRASRIDTVRSLDLMASYIDGFTQNAAAFQTYYATTKRYGKKALEGWADKDAMPDSAFLASAYQASQIMGLDYQVSVFAEIMGAQNVRNIKDPDLQSALRIFISSPSNTLRNDDFDTPYRRNVRRAIAFSIQEQIRMKCGDQPDSVKGSLSLPATCDIDLPANVARAAANDLRARVDLRDDLQWHMASIESVLFDLENELERNTALAAAIREYLK